MNNSELYRKEALDFYVAPNNRIHILVLPPGWLLYGLLAVVCALVFCLGTIFAHPVSNSIPAILMPERNSPKSDAAGNALLVGPVNRLSGFPINARLCIRSNETTMQLRVLNQPSAFEGTSAELPDAQVFKGNSLSQIRVELNCLKCWQQTPTLVSLLDSSRSFFDMIKAGRAQSVSGRCQ